MTRSNKTKAQAVKIDKANKNSNNKSTEEIKKPEKESEKQIPDVKKTLWGDEDYATGFVESRKRVARTPPETMSKRRDTKEEITNREIAETKDCLDIEDPVETEDSSEEDSNDEEKSDDEEAELIDETLTIGKDLIQ